ncbi:hypothetical protein RQP46_010301 [Phenoliferia psychrophenolica]
MSQPPRHVRLPDEIVEAIALSIRPPSSDVGPMTQGENVTLSNMALVSRQWHLAARRVQYSELHLVWRHSTHARLLALLVFSPKLLGMTKTWWDAGEKAAFDTFWIFLGSFENLRRLSTWGIGQDVDAHTLLQVRPALSRLITIRIGPQFSDYNQDAPLSTITPYFSSVDSLVFGSRARAVPPVVRLRAGALRNLRGSGMRDFDAIDLDLTNLVALDLDSVIPSDDTVLATLLPSLPNLKFLRLRMFFGNEDRERFVPIIHHTSVTHLCFDIIPSAEEVAYLPSTLQVLTIGRSASPLDGTDAVAPVYLGIPSWKAQHFPNLVRLKLVGYSLKEHTVLVDLVPQAQAADFTLSVVQTARTSVEGDWEDPETW